MCSHLVELLKKTKGKPSTSERTLGAQGASESAIHRKYENMAHFGIGTVSEF